MSRYVHEDDFVENLRNRLAEAGVAMPESFDDLCHEAVEEARHVDEDLVHRAESRDEDEEVDHYEDPFEDPMYAGDGTYFADPTGRSALRAEGPGNPRNKPCGNCGAPNRLTPADVRRGYQCDSCADRAERGWDY